MTEDQRLNRIEREGIMIESGCSENYARAYCDRMPAEYGVRGEETKREGLFDAKNQSRKAQ